jgi:hypothetical protein
MRKTILLISLSIIALLSMSAVALANDEDAPVVSADCYDNNTAHGLDWSYDGRLDTPGNLVTHYSKNGSCNGSDASSYMLVSVEAEADEDALAYCNSIRSGYRITYQLAALGYDLPDTVWICR